MRGITYLERKVRLSLVASAIVHREVTAHRIFPYLQSSGLSSPQQFSLAPEAPGHLKLVRPLSEVFKQHFFPTVSTNQVQYLQESIALQNLAAMEFKGVNDLLKRSFRTTRSLPSHRFMRVKGIFSWKSKNF